MGRGITVLAVLAVAAFAALVGYAYLGDLSPTQRTVTQPVVLDGN